MSTLSIEGMKELLSAAGKVAGLFYWSVSPNIDNATFNVYISKKASDGLIYAHVEHVSQLQLMEGDANFWATFIDNLIKTLEASMPKEKPIEPNLIYAVDNQGNTFYPPPPNVSYSTTLPQTTTVAKAFWSGQDFYLHEPDVIKTTKFHSTSKPWKSLLHKPYEPHMSNTPKSLKEFYAEVPKKPKSKKLKKLTAEEMEAQNSMKKMDSILDEADKISEKLKKNTMDVFFGSNMLMNYLKKSK